MVDCLFCKIPSIPNGMLLFQEHSKIFFAVGRCVVLLSGVAVISTRSVSNVSRTYTLNTLLPFSTLSLICLLAPTGALLVGPLTNFSHNILTLQKISP